MCHILLTFERRKFNLASNLSSERLKNSSFLDFNKTSFKTGFDNVIEVVLIQKKPLNEITLGHTKSDNIIRIITITDDFYLVFFNKCDFEM